MRHIDLAAVRAALSARDAQTALQAQRFHRLESWRERLLAEPGALLELEGSHPQIEHAAWERSIAAARAERERTGGSGPAARELFRALRALFEGQE